MLNLTQRTLCAEVDANHAALAELRRYLGETLHIEVEDGELHEAILPTPRRRVK